mgnify:CR=1 FL=1
MLRNVLNFIVAVISCLLLIQGCAGVVNKAKNAEKNNDWKEAINLYNKALKENAQDSKIEQLLKKAKRKGYKYYISQAKNELSSENFKKSLRLTNNALQIRPESQEAKKLKKSTVESFKDAQLSAIRKKISEEKYLSASELAKKCIKRWPNLSEASALFTAAQEPLNRVKSIKAKAAELESNGKRAEALKLYRRCLRLVKDYTAAADAVERIESEMQSDMHLARSYAFEHEQRYKKALKAVEKSGNYEQQRRDILEDLADLEDHRYFISKLTAHFEGYKGKTGPIKQKLTMKISIDDNVYEKSPDKNGLVAIKIPQGDKLKLESLEIGKKEMQAAIPNLEWDMHQSVLPWYGPAFEIYVPSSGKLLSRVHYNNALIEVYEKDGKIDARKKSASGIKMPYEKYLDAYPHSRISEMIEYKNSLDKQIEKWDKKSENLWQSAEDLLETSPLNGIVPAYKAICLNPDLTTNEYRIAELLNALVSEGFHKMAHSLAVLPVEVFPEEPECYRWAGKYKEILNEPSEAASFYNKALKLGKQKNNLDEARKAMLKLAELKRRTGQYDSAIESARKFLEGASKNRAEAVQAVMSTLLDANRKSEAVQLLLAEANKDPMVLAQSKDNFWLLIKNDHESKALKIVERLSETLKDMIDKDTNIRWKWVEIASLGPLVENKPQEAIDIFRLIIDSKRNLTQKLSGLQRLASLLKEQGELHLSKQIMKERVNVARKRLGGKNDKEVRFSLIEALYDAGAYDDAWKELEKASKKYHESKKYSRLRQKLLAQKEIHEMLRKQAALNKNKALVDYLESCKERINYSALDEILNKLISSQPNQPEWAIRLAVSKRKQGLPKKSLSIIENSLHNSPNNKELLLEKGRSLAELNEYSKAIKVLSNFKKDNLKAQDLVLLGKMHSAIGNYSNALSAYDKANQKNKEIHIPNYEQVKQLRKTKIDAENSDNLDLLIEYARLLETVGESSSAKSKYNKIMKLHGSKVKAKISYAEFLSRSDNQEKALKILNNALNQSGSEKAKNRVRQAIGRINRRPIVEKNMNKGKSQLWRGKAQQAIKTYRSITEIDPNNAEAFYYLGQAYEAAGSEMTDKAKSAYQKSLALRPGMSRTVKALESLQEIESDLRKLAAYPKDHEAALSIARSYKSRGWMLKAENLALQVLEDQPKHEDALNFLYEVYQRWTFHGRNRAQEAIEIAERRLENYPRSKDAKADLAWACLRADRISRGLSLIKDLLAIAPKKERYLNIKASLLSEVEKNSQAIELYQEILNHNPKSDYVYRNMGLTYKKLNQFKKAENLIRRAYVLDKDDATIVRSYANICMKQGKYHKAAKLFREGLEINSRSLYAREGLAYVHLHLGDSDKSLSLANEIKLVPDGRVSAFKIKYYNALIHDNFEKANNIKSKIVKYLKRRVKKFPDEVDILKSYASACLRYQINTDKALDITRKLKSSDIEGVDVLHIWARIVNDIATNKDLNYLKSINSKQPWNSSVQKTLAYWYYMNDYENKAVDIIQDILKEENSFYYKTLLCEIKH